MKQPQLGEKLSELRKEKGLTQEELSDLSNVGVRTIQRIELGNVEPRLSTIKLLLKSLGHDYQSFREMNNQQSNEKEMQSISRTSKNYSTNLQVSWIAGIVYFMLMIVETIFDISIIEDRSPAMRNMIFYTITKVWVLIAFCIFLRGFVILGNLFENYLIKIAAFLMMGMMTIIITLDIVSVYLYFDDDTLMISIEFSKAFLAGFTGFIFGIGLYRLQDGMGKLSKYAGILEMIIAVFLITLILAPVALALTVPATILEVVLLYKGYEFVEKEMTS